MWRALVAVSVWMSCGAAYAQLVDPPPLVLVPPSYEASPSTLALPTDSSLSAVERARGNLARWRDEERQRLGRYIRARSNGAAAEHAISGVGGYFALFPDTTTRPGIAYGYWSDPASTAGSASLVRELLFVTPYRVCGGQLPWAGDMGLNEIAYLGSVWRPEFEALDASLSALESRIMTGPLLTQDDGLRVAFQVAPDFSRFYPQRALDREIQALVMMGCRVEEDFNLQCGVIGVDVQPPNFALDFGQAAIRAVKLGRPRALETTGDGHSSVGACLRRGIRFALAQ